MTQRKKEKEKSCTEFFLREPHFFLSVTLCNINTIV